MDNNTAYNVALLKLIQLFYVNIIVTGEQNDYL